MTNTDKQTIKEEFNKFIDRLESKRDIENVAAWLKLLMDIFDFQVYL